MSEGLYATQYAEKQYAATLASGNLCDPLTERTVEENIDLKIAGLRKEIERLEASKATLSPLLSMRIRDIREAMSY